MDSNLPGKPTTTSSFFLDSIPKRRHCLDRELYPLFGGDVSTQLKMTGLPVSQILFEVDGLASHPLLNKDFGPGTCWVALQTSRDATMLIRGHVEWHREPILCRSTRFDEGAHGDLRDFACEVVRLVFDQATADQSN